MQSNIEVNLNLLVGALIRDIVSWLNINTTDLPNINDVLSPTSSDYFYLFNGGGTNLKDISRSGNSKLVFGNKTMTLYTGFCLNKINFQYDYDAHFKGHIISGKMTGTIHKLSVKCKMSITKELLIKCELLEFMIDDITVNITGDGIRGWFISPIFSWYLKPLLKPKIQRYAKQKIREELYTILKMINKWAEQYRTRIQAVEFFRLWLNGV